MPSRLDLDENLEQLERELGPELRSALRGHSIRPEFVRSLGQELATLPVSSRRRRLWLIPRRAWAALAAILVVGLASSTAVFALRPQPASAEALSELQNEAVSMVASTNAVGSCGEGIAGGAAMRVTIAEGSPGNGSGLVVAQGSQSDGSGPVTVSTGGQASSDLSDKLAQELGISGDKVRQAMVETMRSMMPTSLPPEPIQSIAQQLGVSRQQVCTAFFDGQSSVGGIGIHQSSGKDAKYLDVHGAGAPNGGLDLATATPEQLAGPAQRLGVSSQRLADVVHKVVADIDATPPPPPPNKDEIIDRFAQNLGLSADKVRAAIVQVEGTKTFYFGVPLPKLGS
jgi:hypothetical protein